MKWGAGEFMREGERVVLDAENDVADCLPLAWLRKSQKVNRSRDDLASEHFRYRDFAFTCFRFVTCITVIMACNTSAAGYYLIIVLF